MPSAPFLMRTSSLVDGWINEHCIAYIGIPSSILLFTCSSDMHNWARAVWIEGKKEEEGVIPVNWIEDTTVRWPRDLNVVRAMSQQKSPSVKWHSFPLVKVKATSSKYNIILTVLQCCLELIEHCGSCG